MKNKIRSMIIIVFVIALSCSPVKFIYGETYNESFSDNYIDNMKRDILSIMVSYKDYVESVEKSEDGKVYLVMKSNRKIVYDDMKNKSDEEKLNNGDIQDMMQTIYPLGAIDKVSDKSYNPGRIRSYALMSEAYGKSESEISKSICYIGNNGFSKRNGAYDCLKNVFNEINSSKDPKISSYVYPTSGAYNYRFVRGTGRLSAHAYGIAIDLKTDNSDYWKWSDKEKASKRIESYPVELIDIFERNNFIWGGKWGYFDIMHFEYRPEIIFKAKYFSDNSTKKPWYDGAPIEDEDVSRFIKVIDEKLK